MTREEAWQIDEANAALVERVRVALESRKPECPECRNPPHAGGCIYDPDA